MQMQETEDTLIVTKKKKHFTGSSKDRGGKVQMKFKTGHEKLPKLKYKVIKEKKSVEKDTKQSLQEPQDYIK